MIIMVRDFSEEQKQRLLEMVREVHPDNVFGLIDDFLDDMFHVLTGGYRINDYLRDISTYHRRMIDIENISANRIQKIFNDVYDTDERFRENFNIQNNSIESIKSLIFKTSESIGSGSLALSGQSFLKVFNGVSKEYDAVAVSARAVKSDSKAKINYSKIWSYVDNIILDGVPTLIYPNVNRWIRYKCKIPTFTINSSRPSMVTISNSQYYHTGSGQAYSRNIIKLLSKKTKLAKQYKIDRSLKQMDKAVEKLEKTDFTGSALTADGLNSIGQKFAAVKSNLSNIKNIAKKTKITKSGWVLIGVGGVVSTANEFINGNYNTMQERIVGSAVEGAFSVGAGVVGTKVGAIVGSVAGPLGTVIGAAVGFAVGVVVSKGIDVLADAKIIRGKSVKDITKDAINSCINFSRDVAATAIGKSVSDVGKGIKSILPNITNEPCGIGGAVYCY